MLLSPAHDGAVLILVPVVNLDRMAHDRVHETGSDFATTHGSIRSPLNLRGHGIIRLADVHAVHDPPDLCERARARLRVRGISPPPRGHVSDP